MGAKDVITRNRGAAGMLSVTKFRSMIQLPTEEIGLRAFFSPHSQTNRHYPLADPRAKILLWALTSPSIKD
jgi:hypothetical protein